MKKNNKHIQIIVTSISGMSSMSRKSSLMLKNILRKNFTKVGISVVNNLEDLNKLVNLKPDLVFIGLKKVPEYENNPDGKNIWVARYLEKNGITTTGSASDAIELEQDKTKAKNAVIAAGLVTSRYFLTSVGEYSEESQLPIKFPLFLKPPGLGAGVGVDENSVVRNFSDFKLKVESLSINEHSVAMAESYLSGREFTVAVMKDSTTDELIVMPIEQLPKKNNRGDRVIGKEMKDAEEETAVALIEDKKIKNAVSELAREVFIILGARDYGRVDIRLDEDGVPHFLEANLIPGLVDGSGNFQKASQLNLGIKYEQMILYIVNLAFSRKPSSENKETELKLKKIINPPLLKPVNIY